MATRIIEVAGAGLAELRRRFSDDDKARIVSEAMMPGASVGDVSRRHRVCKSLRQINADATLEKIFGKRSASMFEMNKHLSAHLTAKG